MPAATPSTTPAKLTQVSGSDRSTGIARAGGCGLRVARTAALFPATSWTPPPLLSPARPMLLVRRLVMAAAVCGAVASTSLCL